MNIDLIDIDLASNTQCIVDGIVYDNSACSVAPLGTLHVQMTCGSDVYQVSLGSKVNGFVPRSQTALITAINRLLAGASGGGGLSLPISPSATLPAGAVILGAASDSATSPSVYPVSTLIDAAHAKSAYGSKGVLLPTTLNNGTSNNDTLIAAALAEIVATSPSQFNRAALIVQGGRYRFDTPFVLPAYTDLLMFGASEFYYQGTDRTQPAITAGGLSGAQEFGGRYEGIQIQSTIGHQWWPVEHGGTVSMEGFVGFRLRDMELANIDIISVSGFAIGFQMFPSSVGTRRCAYNEVKIRQLAGNVIDLDLRGNTNEGFVNENVFFGGNFIGNNTALYGAQYHVRFSTEPGGYTGQNNNVFYKPCFQTGVTSLATGAWTSGAVAVAGRHYNFGGRDYLCSVAGTFTTVGPSHTSGSAANGGATLVYMGLYRRAAVLFDNAGTRCRFVDVRREQGVGPAVIVRGITAGVGSSMELLMNELVAEVPNPEQGYQSNLEIQGVTIGNLALYRAATCQVIHQEHSEISRNTTLVDDLHKKLILGTTNWGAPGFTFLSTTFGAVGSTPQVKTFASTIKLCVNGLQVDGGIGWPLLMLPVDLSWARIAISPIVDKDRVDPPRFSAFLFDSDYKLLANKDTDPILMLASFGIRQPTTNRHAGTSDIYEPVYLLPASASVGYVAVSFSGGRFRGFSVTYISTARNGPVTGVGPIGHLGSFDGPRYSEGSPTAGYFESIGEFISNLSYTAGNSPGWYVSTAGALCPDWVTSTAVVAGELRKNASKVYYAAAAGTTGATAPTHTSGSVSDGTVTWVYHCAQAVLTAAPNA
jgi:hypothetical protein